MFTRVALPPKLLFSTTNGSVPQVAPLILLRNRVGPFTQPQFTEKLDPVVVHPEEFRTVILWLPFTILLKVVPVWKGPPSRL
jgi:hypothetical protein